MPLELPNGIHIHKATQKLVLNPNPAPKKIYTANLEFNMPRSRSQN
jgi:hypothetical protein